MQIESEIKQLTALLATDKSDLWVRLREVLKEKDISPCRTVVAESFEDDENTEFGILILYGERVFQYELDYQRKPLRHADLSCWVELDTTDKNVLDAYEGILPALKIARSMGHDTVLDTE